MVSTNSVSEGHESFSERSEAARRPGPSTAPGKQHLLSGSAFCDDRKNILHVVDETAALTKS